MSPDKKLLILAIVAIVILLTTTIAAVTATVIVLRQKAPAPAPVTSTPESAPITTPPSQPSKFATDTGLLKLRDDIKNLSGRVDSVDLFEPEITPPNLDLNIKIQ